MKKIFPIMMVISVVLTSCVLKTPPKIKVEGTPILGRDVFLKIEGAGSVSWDLDNDGTWDVRGVSPDTPVPFFCDSVGSKKVVALVKDGQKTWRIVRTINVTRASVPVLSLKGGFTKDDEFTVELIGTNMSITGLDVSIDYDDSSLRLVNVTNVSSGVLMPIVDDRRITVGFVEDDLVTDSPETILMLTFSIQKKGNFDIGLSGVLRNSSNEDMDFLGFGTKIVRR